MPHEEAFKELNELAVTPFKTKKNKEATLSTKVALLTKAFDQWMVGYGYLDIAIVNLKTRINLALSLATHVLPDIPVDIVLITRSPSSFILGFYNKTDISDVDNSHISYRYIDFIKDDFLVIGAVYSLGFDTKLRLYNPETNETIMPGELFELMKKSPEPEVIEAIRQIAVALMAV